MVGLAIGMLAMLVIMQVFTVFEAQKRTTTGAGDAQTNGNLALYLVARDLKQAGFALMPTALPAVLSPFGCANLTVDGVADGSVPNRIFPVAIANNAANGSDTLRVSYGDSDLGANPMQILNVGPTATLPTANDAQVGDSFGCAAGSRTLVLSQDGLTCSLSTASAVVAAAGGVPAYVSLVDATAVAGGANLACLGNWNEITYSASNGNMQQNGNPILSGIVNLQAQYGISAAGLGNTSPDFNTVAEWKEATGSWAAPSASDRLRIKAIRVAVIARNAKKQMKDPATNACNTTAACSSLVAAAPTGLCAWAGSASSPAPAVDLSVGDPDWACYRYRVFETVIPLRNVIWSREAL